MRLRPGARPIPVLALALLLVTGPAAAAAVTLVNPGFEQLEPPGTIAGWQLDRATSSSNAGLAGVDSPTREGVGALALSLDGHGTATAVSQPVHLEVSRLYRLSAWVRTDGAVADPGARYPTAVPACLSMASFPFTNHSPAVGGDAEWTRVETLFFATQSEDRVRLHLGRNGTARGRAVFDDVRLEEVEDITEYIPLERVRWHGPAFRYDDRGWIIVHVEGEPYERGVQYGSLVADEIVDYISKLAYEHDPHDPAAGWNEVRFRTDALFLRGYDPEYLREMKGIADGAAAAGAAWNDRPLDLLDIAAVNSVIDLGQLEDALEVTPHALTGEALASPAQEMDRRTDRVKCSAFAATGPATADGQVVFGQIFMWGGYTGVHWNVMVDLVPTSGHRLVYQTFPGGIHSGADFYVNSAGIVIGETTVAQTPFEPRSTPQSNRIRKAAQYASSIDDVERLLWDGNNGMYTNDWPIADMDTGEVAILLLGTHRKRLWRSTDTPAPFDTPGFLWANNNNRDDEVRKEYLAQPDERPFDLMFGPWNRDIEFNRFYREHAGRIDAEAAIRLWASSPINRAHACDGKITTTEMARHLMFLAHHGKTTLREKFPKGTARIMPDRPGAIPHLTLGYTTINPVFVAERLAAARAARPETPVAAAGAPADPGEAAAILALSRDRLWRGTVLPASPADGWFVSASAAYWRLLDDLDEDDPEAALGALADALGEVEARLLFTLSREPDLAAVAGHRAYDRYGPYVIPRLKGIAALHQLHLLLGTETFLNVMRTVHERFAGRETTTAEIIATAEEAAGRPLVAFLDQWLQREGVPRFDARVRTHVARRGGHEVEIVARFDGDPWRVLTHVEVETSSGRSLHRVELDHDRPASIHLTEQPLRVRVNPLHDVPVAHERFYTWRNLTDEFHRLLVVYGTADQLEANHTLARRWQETLADAYIEILPPLVKDAELTAGQAGDHDLIVLGDRVDNAFLDRIAARLPLEIGRRWFSWQGVTYARPEHGLILVLPNPANPARAVYLILANSALELHRMTSSYRRDVPAWAVFAGDEIVARGHHLPPSFEVSLAGS